MVGGKFSILQVQGSPTIFSVVFYFFHSHGGNMYLRCFKKRLLISLKLFCCTDDKNILIATSVARHGDFPPDSTNSCK